MKKGIAKFTAFCLTAGLAIGEGSGVYLGAGADMVLIGLGSASADSSAADENTVVEDTVEDTVEETAEAAEEVAAVETEAQTEAAPVIDRSMVGTTGFAQCDEYLNVRASGDTEGEVVGKIYNNGSLEILDVDEYGWYHVRSGNVEGYVSSDYVAVGSAAESIAATTGYTTAEVGAEYLNVRAEASTDAEIVDVIENALSVEVVQDNGDWVKVVTDDGIYGYVSADYVYTSTAYATGETLEEEQARLDAEWLAYLADQEAERQAAEAAYYASTDYSYTDTSYSEPSYTYTEEQAYADQAYYEAEQAQQYAEQASYEAQAATQYTYDAQASAESLYQVYLDAQAAADAAVASGDEQLIYSTAEAAQAAYGSYVTAQDAADAAAQAEADAAAQAQAAADAQAAAEAAAAAAQAAAQEASYDTYEDDTYTEDTYTEENYYEESYEDTYEEEVYEEPAPAASSLGQEIANYACQFVGNPYVWGGTSLTNGADCSGFVMSVYANYGVSLPHSAAAQSGYGTSVSVDQLQPGDLLFYGDGGISHVTMYIGGGQVVHASSSTTGIIISSVGYRTPVCCRRLV